MVVQGWDWNSSSTTITTPWLLSCGWLQFWLQYPTYFIPRWSMFGLIQEFHSISTIPISHYKYNERLWKVEIGKWALKWSPQRIFQPRVGSKLALAHTHFSYPDWVCNDWFGQFTASQPFQCLIMSIMDGCARLRSEFIIHNHHHTPAFESWVVARSAPVPCISHQDCVFSDWL